MAAKNNARPSAKKTLRRTSFSSSNIAKNALLERSSDGIFLLVVVFITIGLICFITTPAY